MTEHTTELMGDDVTIIDGDILETTFEEFGTQFDRFQYVVIYDMQHGEFFGAVPYLYARNIAGIRTALRIVPLVEHPEQSEWAVNNELLQLQSANSDVLVRLVEKQAATISTLYRELCDYRELDMLDNSTRRRIKDQLIAFLKSIKVGNTEGEGIFWLPENYRGDGDEDRDFDNDDDVRRTICGHIRRRPLPMAHLMPIPDEQVAMMLDFIDIFPSIREIAQETHFAPLFRGNENLSHRGLKTLMAEEFRCVKNEETITPAASFIFRAVHLTSRHTIPIDEARTHLRYYVGYYFDDLDLSRTFITGSAISASIINVSHNTDHETFIDLLYPKVLTEIPAQHLEQLRNDNITLWNIMAVSETEGKMVKSGETINFSIKPGADVDLAVDNTVSDEEYRAIAQQHFEVIRRYYPYVKIREYTKPKGDWNYVIYTDDPDYIPVFRTVEIYRSSFRNICSHHVGAVRGCYTARWGHPQFYLTASAIFTSRYHATPNYHYFAGRKSNPQDIIIKNMQRGIDISDQVLKDIMNHYILKKGIHTSRFPFYEGRNVPYSIFAAGLEYPFVRVGIQRRLDRQGRSQRRHIIRADRQHRAQAERELFQAAEGHVTANQHRAPPEQELFQAAEGHVTANQHRYEIPFPSNNPRPVIPQVQPQALPQVGVIPLRRYNPPTTLPQLQ